MVSDTLELEDGAICSTNLIWLVSLIELTKPIFDIVM